MIIPLLAEVTSGQLWTGGIVGGGFYLIKSFFDVRAAYDDSRDRKVIRDQIVTQTDVLKNIFEEQKSARAITDDLSKNLAVAMERQDKTSTSISRTERAVLKMAVAQGIPGTDL